MDGLVKPAREHVTSTRIASVNASEPIPDAASWPDYPLQQVLMADLGQLVEKRRTAVADLEANQPATPYIFNGYEGLCIRFPGQENNCR